jgi:hypothetical protein
MFDCTIFRCHFDAYCDLELHNMTSLSSLDRYVQRRRAFEERERDKVLEQRKFEESLRDRQMRVRFIFLRVCCAESSSNLLQSVLIYFTLSSCPSDLT